ncbi:MAG: guanylate kinase [Candidatus Glassbacteria bacterium RIFCSPLOWO2_12_FULL_58_11]|uniref:Guanylate kinase n=1 Tax=Candidatus Glassbacteria bacterium RIFCSPLOWO2_12_FULL_58_11 TaxID=1817867 RepID=A0A1F5Z2H8_9BACT|nr:MAG: guanylate kinase [Candidatus Glassbacteria bacterium RIFCSPLOWO2_12_FULL_58_11]
MKRFWESKAFIVVITAPSGTGKTSVIHQLLERDRSLRYSISATTRPGRPAEVEGRDYFFLSEAEFDAGLGEKKFAEWATVHGYRYGTLKSQIESTLEQGHHVLMDVDVQGAYHLRKLYPDGVFIALMPPSMAELRKRLSGRGTEDTDSLAQRLKDAENEIEALLFFDYLVVNDRLEETCEEISAIIRAEELRVKRISGPDSLIGKYLDKP